MSRPRLDEAPRPLDYHVGAKVKTRRLVLGLSQDELAKAIGLTFQQVQKYEKGSNRISVSRLMDIARALKVPFTYFIDGATGGARKVALRGVSDAQQAPFEDDPMTRKDVLELVRHYSRITKPQLKKQILEMAKAMANTAGDE